MVWERGAVSECRPIIYPPVKRSTPSPPYFPTTTISLMAPSLQISSPLSSALLNWPCWLKKEPSIPTPPTLPPRSSLVAKFQSSQQRATELATLAEEGPAMRGEVARLRMELGLVAQAQREREQHVVVRKGGLGGGGLGGGGSPEDGPRHPPRHPPTHTPSHTYPSHTSSGAASREHKASGRAASISA